MLSHVGTRNPRGELSAEVGGSKGGILSRMGVEPPRCAFPEPRRRDLGGVAVSVGGVREGRGRRPTRSAGQSPRSGPLTGSSFQPWLRAAGAGGTGRRGLGPGCLPPGALRVGARHPWGWMGTRGGLQALSGGVGPSWGRAEKGRGEMRVVMYRGQMRACGVR